MFWSEFSSAILAAVLSGMWFKFFDSLDKQRELLAIIIALKNECIFNRRGRGSQQSPFQIHWLEKALLNLNFHEQCSNIAQACLDIFELAKDANLDQLKLRKLSNGESMQPGHVQDLFTMILEDIDRTLSEVIKDQI